MKCPTSFGQIEQDMAKFPVIDLKRLRNEGFGRLGQTAVCHYSLVKGKVCFVKLFASFT